MNYEDDDRSRHYVAATRFLVDAILSDEGPQCHCELCRALCKLLASRGFLAHIKDRWWEHDDDPWNGEHIG
jgi:hypothetical protein